MTAPGFHPTHVVPQDGLPAWETPDPSRPTVPLDALLPVQLVERHGDWGHVVCANGWSAWVDGRLLVAVPRDPPAAGADPSRARDPRPLLARAEETLGRYRSIIEDLADGNLDGQSFRDGTLGLRIGLVVDGESLWLYDTDHDQWLYCDGAQLSTYATPRAPAAADEPAPVVRETEARPVSEPGSEGGRDHEPTRLAGEPERESGGGRDREPTRIVRPGDAG
ncbi:hypothetical protein [Streptomyces spongiae]|uniref:SH3 domain-containing protein n=1 Tax=Streptomyces spongiae TaxID=565072 RepID=A0A5N8XBI6_9ACTN|nr:hypothetical protein [Streptomyces spongiae]MPY56268.1 hypothetical protein [Streptomyces spongiae]